VNQRAAEPDVTAYLASLRQTIETALERTLAALGAPAPIGLALHYGLMGGGKRLRPCLTLAAAETVGVRTGLAPEVSHARALPAACAVEMVHSYSLVHDDLPAMDDDALRRGRPTTHVVYGDGLAVLAGDGLLTEAVVVLSSAPAPGMPAGAPEPTADQRLRAVHALARAAGTSGMVGGQAIDLAAAGRVTGRPARQLGAVELEDMHRRKTGALIRAPVTMGAIVAGADEPTVDAADDYARDLGLAFQIVDDILDVEGSAQALGKTAGKDAAAGKPTYPASYGIEGSRRMAADCIGRAIARLDRANLGGPLAAIARWSQTRRA
jgi:geranylgeranyl pyrophosphate synthase